MAASIEMGAGFAALEEGDDRLRPAAALHLGITPFYACRLYHWGRKHGPSTERSTLVSGIRRFNLFRSNAVEGGIGLALMNEMVQVDYGGSAPKEHDRNENNFNAGMAFSLSFRIPKTDPLYMTLSWDSHVFPAGLAGGLLLASGRKQALSFIAGLTL